MDKSGRELETLLYIMSLGLPQLAAVGGYLRASSPVCREMKVIKVYEAAGEGCDVV